MTRALPLLAAVGAISAFGLALAGCASGSIPEGTVTAPAEPVEMEVDAAWLDAGRFIGVVTWGSSTCVPGDGGATLADDGTIEVVLADPAELEPERPCTEDYRARVTVVGVPEGVDASQPHPVSVTLGAGSGTTELPGLADAAAPGTPTDYAPSAGWTSTPGMIVYLTWGSSTCVPLVQDVQLTGEAQVTVAFQEPDPDRMCTMDMAPRAGLVEAPELAPTPGAELVLTGDGFDAVPVRILGA
ncbi:hypothetical protein [Microbacterium sp. GXF7504]